LISRLAFTDVYTASVNANVSGPVIGAVATPAIQADGAKAKREELRKKVMEERKAKHEAAKAKRDEVKAAHAKAEKAAKKITPETPAKQ